MNVGFKAGCYRREHQCLSRDVRWWSAIEKLTLLWKNTSVTQVNKQLPQSWTQKTKQKKTIEKRWVQLWKDCHPLLGLYASNSTWSSTLPRFFSLSVSPFFSPLSHSQSFMEDNVEPNWLMHHRQSTGWHGQMSRALSRDAIGWQRENLGHWSHSLGLKDGAEPQRTM